MDTKIAIASNVLTAVGVGVAVYTVVDARNVNWNNFCTQASLDLASLEGEARSLLAEKESLEEVLSGSNPEGVSAWNLGLMKQYQRALEFEIRYSRMREGVRRAQEQIEERFGVDFDEEKYPLREHQVKGAYEIFNSTLEQFGFPRTHSERAKIAREIQAYLGPDTYVNIIAVPEVEGQTFDLLWSIFGEVVRKALFSRDEVTRYDFGMSLQGMDNLSERIVAYERELRRVQSLEREINSDIDRLEAKLIGVNSAIDAQETALQSRECGGV